VVSRFIKVHTGSKVTAIHVEGKRLISASKDNKLALMSIVAGAIINFEKLIDLATITASQNLPLGFAKSIDYFNDNLLVGLRNGTIVEIKNGEQSRIVAECHFEGETWGLHICDDGHVITSGADNRIILFDIKAHKCIASGKISNNNNPKKAVKMASTMGKMPTNKQSRAVTASKKHNHLVVCSNTGKVSVRSLDNFD